MAAEEKEPMRNVSILTRGLFAAGGILAIVGAKYNLVVLAVVGMLLVDAAATRIHVERFHNRKE